MKAASSHIRLGAAAALLLISCSTANAMKVTSCRTISSWEEFTEALDTPDESGNVVNFCPFDITHNGDEDDGYDVTTDYLRVSCDKKTGTAGDAVEQVTANAWGRRKMAFSNEPISGEDPPKCIIRGTARHLNVNSKAMTMIGFDMYGSANSAIRIEAGASMTTLTEMAFVENEGSGALSIASGATKTTVLHCEFTSNEAAEGGGGGAIQTDVDGADLMVYRSYFHTNSAPESSKGGAIFANTAFTVSRSEFLANTVADANGPAIYDADGTACDGGENIACLNTDLVTNEDCDGIYSDPTAICYAFDSACEFPSVTPTVSPTAKPTASPSFSPLAKPSAAPSGGPTPNPSPSPSYAPTASPTLKPSASPSISQLPTASPSANPSHTPTARPSGSPSCAPSFTPSMVPTGPTPSPTADLDISPPQLVTPQFPVAAPSPNSGGNNKGKGNSGKGGTRSPSYGKGSGGKGYSWSAQPHVNHQHPNDDKGKGSGSSSTGGTSSPAVSGGNGGVPAGTATTPSGGKGSSGKGSTATTVGGQQVPGSVTNDSGDANRRHYRRVRNLEEEDHPVGVIDDYPDPEAYKHTGSGGYGKGSAGKGSGSGVVVPGQGVDKCSEIPGPQFPAQRQRKTKAVKVKGNNTRSSVARSRRSIRAY
eukprot:CAMPEP_0196805694 /NCGR_PEP_ID=MMETSP1362-20130617/5512_1 /TAXON_ID=163516 /ORGANISM="Leptocylindrus danicus, Strain CCMP1856" /LENGTH=649 /DNA_ID=CAMNT_0042178781 /DNA_START=55 /DNA_END=2004 /DNA_ORIENTATION=+